MAYHLGMMLQCDYCQAEIPATMHPFTLRMELYPAVEPSLQFTERDLNAETGNKLEDLVRLLEEMDEAEVARQEKIVYFSHQFTLCHACRHKMAQALERLLPEPGKS